MIIPPCSSLKFYKDEQPVGSMCFIECSDSAFRVVKLSWGAPEDFERNHDGEVEMSWTIQGEALARLMKTCNSAKTPIDVIDYLHEHFAIHKRQAHRELLKWFDKKGINYYYSEY